jgi:hypothetical protein
VESLSDDFDIEQKEIVEIIRTKERSETSGGMGFEWNKFNGDIACRVVKEFLRRRLPNKLKVVGPNVYVDGYPTEFDLLLVTESAIPAAFTSAYTHRDVRFVIEMSSHGDMSRDFPERLLTQFTALQMQTPNVNCACLMTHETRNPKTDDSMSYGNELKKVLEPRYRVFCLTESGTHELIPGQWREFVNHLAKM